MERNQTIHDVMMEKVQTYTTYIGNGRKLVAIRSEQRIKEIAGFYSNGDIGYIPEGKVQQLILVFQGCQKIGFWDSGLPLEIEKTIQHLKNNL